MPPKKSGGQAPNKKTVEKKKEKIIEVGELGWCFNGGLGGNWVAVGCALIGVFTLHVLGQDIWYQEQEGEEAAGIHKAGH